MALQGQDSLAILDVPYLDGVVLAGSGQDRRWSLVVDASTALHILLRDLQVAPSDCNYGFLVAPKCLD